MAQHEVFGNPAPPFVADAKGMHRRTTFHKRLQKGKSRRRWAHRRQGMDD
jgi:hypothetical protein